MSLALQSGFRSGDVWKLNKWYFRTGKRIYAVDTSECQILAENGGNVGKVGLWMSVCVACGVVVEVKGTGRARQRCQACLKAHRKSYQAQQYRKTAPTKKPRKTPAYTVTLKGTQSSLKLLAQYQRSEEFKWLQHAGGSGYSYPLGSTPKHLRPLPPPKAVSNSVKMSEELRQFLLKKVYSSRRA
jgi:hypothetical protein